MRQKRNNMGRTLSRIFYLFALIGILGSCKPQTTIDLTQKSLIPLPVSVTATNGIFKLRKKTDIYVTGDSDELLKIGDLLAKVINPSTGFQLEVKSIEKKPSFGNIWLVLNNEKEQLGTEGYELSVTPKMIKISANHPAGIFHGIQSLRQILPAKIEKETLQTGPWLIPTGNIQDYPDYVYRGTMLDVSRHFFKPNDIKQIIDLLAFFKFNTLHLHLSDDQGWRIEIKAWPNLATHGGSTEVGGGAGGFYTQEEYKDIVAYARDRYITIVPEIDMPGHTNAALSSYPELNCNEMAPDLYTGTNVGFSTLCTQKEITYKFIDDVIGELADLSPGPYIHIGGDESHSTPMKDYIPFVQRVQQIVLAHGKKVIGWDEIANTKLENNTTVQFWARVDNALKGVKKGAKVIMSPANRTYLDMQYDSTTTLGLHWAGYVDVDSAYIWDPATLVPGITRKNILGVESALWTETITNLEEMEYMMFPRLAGHSEIGWTPATKRNWDNYKGRLANFALRFHAMGVNFYPSPLVPWVEE